SFRGVVGLMRMNAFVAAPDGKGGDAPIPENMKALVNERREQLVEAAAEGDDSLLEKYLDEGTLSDEEVERGLRAGIAEAKVCPVVCCSASKQLGVRTLIRALCDLLPAPEVAVSGPARALVFNTYSD